jgi:hypothetical protein
VVELRRLENESDEEVIYRICMAKEQIGTWTEVADVLNNILGNEYTESKYRKQFQAFNKMMNANQDKLLDTDGYIAELENTRKQLHKERIKLQTLNIERNRLDREEARHELFYELVGAVCGTLQPPTFKPFTNGYRKDISYVLTIADVHYGADFKTVNNEYSREIAKQRFEYLAARVKDFVEEKHLRTLYVVSLGDLVQGILRVSDLKLNDTSLVKCVVEIASIIASFLNEVSSFVEVEYYHVPQANHTQLRLLSTKASALPDEDLEYVIGSIIKTSLVNNDRVMVHTQEDSVGYIDIDIPANTLCAMHGHQIRNFENAIKDIEALTGRYYSALLLGHYHSGKEIPTNEGEFGDKEVLISSSFIGSDPYSESLFKGTKAACKIYGFNGAEGHIESYKMVLN